MKRKLKQLTKKYFRSKNVILVSINHVLGTETHRLISNIKNETEMVLTDPEAYLLYSLAEKTNKIEGDMAEVGVYKGGSAKLLRATNDKKILHLFDTFEGLPETSEFDNEKQFQKGNYHGTFDEVKHYLQDCNNLKFYKGYFPDTAVGMEDTSFSFVHLDVDLYESTKSALEFFYPKMTQGGIIISHDYTSAPGVKKAFDEFVKDKTEIVLETYGSSQGFLIKCS